MRRAKQPRKAAQSAGVEFNAVSQHRRDTELEQWACERLRLRDLFAGVTTSEIRRDRLKAVLLERHLTESIAGRRDGKPIKWRALFEQLYRETL